MKRFTLSLKKIRLTFLTGHSDDSKKRIPSAYCAAVCEATGGPHLYTMKTSRDGLGIKEMYETLP